MKATKYLHPRLIDRAEVMAKAALTSAVLAEHLDEYAVALQHTAELFDCPLTEKEAWDLLIGLMQHLPLELKIGA